MSVDNSFGTFVVCNYSNIGTNAGVVKKLIGQCYYSFEPIIFYYPFANIAFATFRSTCKKWWAFKHNSDVRYIVLHLRNHMLQEKQQAIVNPWQSGSKTVAHSFIICLCFNCFLSFLPIYTKWRIWKHIVKLFVLSHMPGYKVFLTNNTLTISRITSLGVKFSPAVSLDCSDNFLMSSSKV